MSQLKKIEEPFICPFHNKKGKIIPPPVVDKKRKKLIHTLQCPEGHQFKIEFDLK